MRRLGTLAAALILAAPAHARAQQSVTDILSFLLTNRSIATDSPVLDEAAAVATRDAISQFLLLDVATLPTLSSSAGFIYRVDPDLGGAVVRASESFGPAFVERSLTVGTIKPAFGFSFQDTTFNRIDGRSLSDGSLVAIAGRLSGQTVPFDVETLALNLRTRALTMSATVGVTDRLDVSALLPIVRLTMNGERVDTFRGTPLLQATASADASGVGDLILRAKYNAIRRGASGIAVGAEVRLPTGDAENLLGTGEAAVRPRVIGSLERGRVSLHTELGYAAGGLSGELTYAGAIAVAATPRVTVAGEWLGRRLASGGRLTETIAPHPTLAGVETIRLTVLPEATHRATVVGSVKWNAAQTWLLSASLQCPVTDAGLTSGVTPSIAVEFSFGR